MSTIALLLLLLISAAGTIVQGYPPDAEVSKTVNEAEAVQSKPLAADNAPKSESEITKETDDVGVKTALEKPPVEKDDVGKRNMNGNEKTNVPKSSPNKDDEEKNAVVSGKVKEEGAKREAGSETANDEHKSAEGADSKVSDKAVRNFSGESAEATENEEAEEESPAEKMIKPSDDSDEGAGVAPKSLGAETPSAGRLLEPQAVPISKMSFESDLESLSPELRELASSKRNSAPSAEEIMDDIRKRPMISHIKYAKETLFPPITGQSSSDDRSSQNTQKVSMDPYKESWELTYDPMMKKLTKSATSNRMGSQIQIESQENTLELVAELMVQLEGLSKQFAETIDIMKGVDLPGSDFNVSLEHRSHLRSPSFSNDMPEKFKSLSDELADVKNTKKLMGGRDHGASPLNLKIEALSSELAVDGDFARSMRSKCSKKCNRK